MHTPRTASGHWIGHVQSKTANRTAAEQRVGPGPPRLRQCGAAAAGIAILDLTTKAVALRALPEADVRFNPRLSLAHGPLAPRLPIPVAAIGLVCLCVLAWWCLCNSWLPSWPFAAVVGGALGNTLDYLAGGGIVDFIPMRPVIFNLADVAVVSGALGAVLNLCRSIRGRLVVPGAG